MCMCVYISPHLHVVVQLQLVPRHDLRSSHGERIRHKHQNTHFGTHVRKNRRAWGLTLRMSLMFTDSVDWSAPKSTM